jgi:hypothetical protein
LFSERLKSFLANFLTTFLSLDVGSAWNPSPDRRLAFCIKVLTSKLTSCSLALSFWVYSFCSYLMRNLSFWVIWALACYCLGWPNISSNIENFINDYKNESLLVYNIFKNMKLVGLDFYAHKGLSQKSLNIEKLPREKVLLDPLQVANPRLVLL